MLIKFPKNHSSQKSSSSQESAQGNRFKLNRPPTLSAFDNNFLEHRNPVGRSNDNLLDSDEQSPPISPLRLQQLSPSASSISSWGSLSLSQASQLSDDGLDSHHISHAGLPTSILCNSDSNGSTRSSGSGKETYNTRFARKHLDAYRQSDRIRWNFDFDHNRPLDQEHTNSHHRPSSPRYQWEPAGL